MSTNVVQLRGVRKPPLVLIKGGRGKPATPPFTDDERYPRFPPAWVDWLVLGLGLAALNLPSPIPLFCVGGIVLIAVLVTIHFTKAGGRDPNSDDGITTVLAAFFKDVGVRRPVERRLPAFSAFNKQIVVFFVCESTLCLGHRFLVLQFGSVEPKILTIVFFIGVTLLGLKALMWWDTPGSSHKES